MDIRNISIKKRLYTSFGICIFFIVLLCAIALNGMWKIDGRTKEAINVAYEKTISSQKIINAVSSTLNSLAIIASEKDNSEINKEKEIITAKTKTYKEEIDNLEKLESTDKGKAIIGKCKGLLDKAQAINNQIVELAVSGNNTDASQKYLNELKPLSKELAGVVEEMAKHQDQGLKTSLEGIKDSNSGTKMLLLACGFISIAIGIMAAFYITKTILRPIDRIAYLTQYCPVRFLHMLFQPFPHRCCMCLIPHRLLLLPHSLF